ncbi:hypothetical protein C8Q80DRAFT_1276099 [Daedaleopsis nitida]|nr:hypothetical protein C8Q80DRAFT_1276099 [Daedaleopsis nitida]
MARNPKKKHFVEDKDAAVDLARSVADIVEENAARKIKMRRTKASARAAPEHHARAPSSKERLERAKAAVAAEAARAKRDKAKMRKNARASSTPSQNGQKVSPRPARQTSGEMPSEHSGGKTQKRVTFG